MHQYLHFSDLMTVRDCVFMSHRLLSTLEHVEAQPCHFRGGSSPSCRNTVCHSARGWMSRHALHVESGAEFFACIDSIRAKFLLDSQDLVHLGNTLGTGRSTSLDLSSSKTHSDVGNSDILGLARSVRDHDAPTCSVGVFCRLDRFGECADLVYLQQQGVARLELDCFLNADWIGDGQIISVSRSVEPH